MIRHCVAHPFGAAVGRSSQQAALLEPSEGSHPPSLTSALRFPQKQKTDHQVGSFEFGGEGGIRTLILTCCSTNITFNFNNLRNYR